MTERTETDVILENPVMIHIAGLEIEVKPVKGRRWIELSQRLLSLAPREEISNAAKKGSITFDAADPAELINMLIRFGGSHLTSLFDLFVEALPITDEQREQINENAEPDEILIAAREAAPVLFPLERLANAAKALGLTEETEATNGKAPKVTTRV